MPTLDSLLLAMPRRIRDGGAEAAWQQLEATAVEVTTKRPDTPADARGLLLRAIDLTKLNDPAGALQLIELAAHKGFETAKLTALRATCFDRTGRHEDAKAETLKVVEASDSDPEAVLVAANLLVRYNEQEKALRAALDAYEKLDRPLRHTATVLYITQRCAAFAESDRLTRQIADAYLAGDLEKVNESPRTNLLWSADERMNIAVTQLWARKSLPRDRKQCQRPPEPLNGRPLKIGYLSSDFREHPTLRLMMGALRHHDRKKYEIVMVCSGWDDGSPIRKEAEALCSKVLTVTHLNDREAADAIKQEGIDVLVELNGPTRANRMSILSYRPAPVQIDYLGWAGSVGGVGVDFVVGDHWTIPPGAEKRYPERVMRMDPTYQINDHRGFPPIVAKDRAPLGVPNDKLVFGVFNAVNKIQGDVWALWMQILKQVPNSVMWILDPGNAARRRLGQLAAQAGVDVKRIIGARAMPQGEHLHRIAAADLMLDPWPYGGHTSTSDALYAGVPVVTINGTNFPGRVSAGLLRSAGLPELVCANPQDYLVKVLTLAGDPELLASYKRALDEVRETTCFDAPNRTKQLEAMYSYAYEQWVEGKPQQNINVPNARATQPRLLPESPLAVTVSDATTGYGSAPEWVRTGTMPEAARRKPSAPRSAPRREVVLVAGPWSSGSSATAQVIEALGAKLVGEMFQTRDERTTTYEMAAFRKVLMGLSDELSVKRTATRDEALSALRRFDHDYLANENGPILLKHPLSALFIPELEQVFDMKIVTVMRPFHAIEATRQRRNWQPAFGQAGAQRIYLALNNALADCQSPMYWFKYQDLISNPYRQVMDIANFLGYGRNKESLEKAISRVRRK